MRMCYSQRRTFSMLIRQLMHEGKEGQGAGRLAIRREDGACPSTSPYDWQNGSLDMAEAYYQLGETAEGDWVAKALADKAVQYLTWYLSLDDRRFLLSSQ